MICKYCGRTIQDGSTVCPFCGSSASLYEDSDDMESSDIMGSEFDDEIEEPSSGRKKRGSFKMPKFSMPKPRESAPRQSSAKASMPNISMPKLNISTIVNLICIVLLIVCLMRISALSTTVKEQNSIINANMSQLQSGVRDINDKLSALDTTVANVQTDAYNQYASQAVSITKDLTNLTGPVTAGKYNQMFIVNAKGNLNLSTSFDWQKYNDATRNWVSIEFTGTATSNDDYGLRIENSYDKDTATYISVLWANGITPAAAGTYRCVITDINGLSNYSSEAIVSVTFD